MGIGNLYGSGGGGGASVAGDGSGFLVKRGDQLIARDVVPVFPVKIDNGEGAGGPLVIRAAAQRILASALIDGTVTTDQVLEVLGADEYVIRSIVFTEAGAVPSGAMAGGVYTRVGKTGHILAPASTKFDTLTSARKMLEIPVNLGESVSAPFIYVSLTTANPTALALRCHVIGDVLRYATA